MINYKNIPKLSGIYKFTNKINNKVYIGQAKNLRNRVRDHLSAFQKNKFPNIYIYKSMKKHGLQNFELEILIEGNFSKTELDEMEICYIRLLKSNNSFFGYNMTIGGDGANGRKTSQQTKDKIGKANKGHEVSQETRQKIRQTNLGHKHTDETKEKMKGRKHSKETIEKRTESRKGYKHSKETKEKIGKVQKGRKHSKQQIEKMIQSKIGFKHSKETIQKMKNKKISQEHKNKLSQLYTGKKQSLEVVENRVKSRMLNRARKLIQESSCYKEYFYNNFVYKS